MDKKYLFTQVPHEIYREWAKILPSTAHVLLGIIIDKTKGWNKNSIKITQKELAVEMNKSERSIQRNLNILIEKDLILVENKKTTHKLTSNTYRINYDKLLIQNSFTYDKNVVGSYDKNVVSKNYLTQGKKRAHPYYTKESSLSESKESASKEACFFHSEPKSIEEEKTIDEMYKIFQ